jgi:predicted RNase H-like HicB family nuclease
MARKYTVIYELAEDGGYYAHIPALEVTTEGQTLEEAKEMARDAIENTMACMKDLNLPFPDEVGTETVGVNE